MVQNPPSYLTRVTPYLCYRDVAAALDWLARVFGFHERVRMPGPDGAISHAEMDYQGGVVMLGCPKPDYRNPKKLGEATQSLYVYVDDVDKHFRRASEAGAKILEKPEDQFYGDRRYGTEDPEGHLWYFAQHVHDPTPEEMQKGMKGGAS